MDSGGRKPNKSFNQNTKQSANEPNWNVDNWNNEVFKYEQDTLIKNKLGLIVNKRYEIVQRIDAGAFGSTYIGEDLQNGRLRVAVKFDTGRPEWKKSKKDENHLKYEFEVYKSALYDDGFEVVDGFAKVFWFGYEYGHNILVMELLGASIASLFAFCNRRFGLQTVLSLAKQMVYRIRHIHQRGFIHRDIKPENFLVGMGEKETTCYLIDFGLARRYRFRHPDDRTLKHIPFRRGRSFIGTAKYASVNSHRSLELSRRDDLESLGYVLIELINGYLPWRNACRRNPANKHQTYLRIRVAKEQTNWKDVCPPMADFMRYCRELQFSEEPDYEKVMSILTTRLSGDPKLFIRNPSLKCEDCRTQEKRRRIDRIDEELSFPNGIAENRRSSLSAEHEIKQPPTLIERPASANGIEFVEELEEEASIEDRLETLKLDPEPSTSATSQNFVDGLPKTKFTQSSVENISPTSSMENIKTNLSANVDLMSPLKKSNSEAADEDADSVTSCQNCRLQQQQYFDRECAGGSRLSWQIWRDSTPEHRFEYDNRFSWTVYVVPRYPQPMPYPQMWHPSIPPPPFGRKFPMAALNFMGFGYPPPRPPPMHIYPPPNAQPDFCQTFLWTQ